MGNKFPGVSKRNLYKVVLLSLLGVRSLLGLIYLYLRNPQIIIGVDLFIFKESPDHYWG